MEKPKDILSQPYHIQEYINYLEKQNEDVTGVKRMLEKTLDKIIKEKQSLQEEKDGLGKRIKELMDFLTIISEASPNRVWAIKRKAKSLLTKHQDNG